MNSDKAKGSWKEFKGKVKQKWGKLKDDELDRMEGKREEVVGQIQKNYGKSKEEAEKEYDEWNKNQNIA